MQRFWCAVVALALAAGCEDHEGIYHGPRARAERITSTDQLLSGRTARGQVGDWKIWNDRVAFVIQDAGLASGYQRYGGMPIDADVARAPGAPGYSQLGALFFGFDERIFEPLAVEVVAAGEDGERAVVRVTGRDTRFQWLESFLAEVDPIDSDLVYEYSLGPGDEALRIDVTVRSRAAADRVISNVEAAFIMGDGLRSYFEGPGFDDSQHSGRYRAWYGLGERVAYGLGSNEGSLQMLMNYDNVALGTYPQVTLPAGGELRFTRHLAVAEGGIARAQAILRALSATPEPVGRLRGRVIADAAAHGRGVRVHVLAAPDDHRSVVLPDVAGAFDAELPAGSYSILAKADGYLPSATQTVDVVAGQETTAHLTIAPSTPLRFAIVDEHGAPLPARLSFHPSGAEAANVLPRSFGEESHQNGAALAVYSASGSGEGLLPVGTYEVTASRGLEYELDRQTITVGSQPLDLSFSVTRAVDSTGWLAGDFHAHGQYSPDTSIAPEARVRTALAAGVDLLPMTEHDWIGDYTDVVAGFPGAADHLRAVGASEVTTYVYGHFNVWPLTARPDELNNGGIDWFDTPGPDLFARIRASEPHDVVIQVNHPRSPSIGGYFSAVGLDTTAGTIERWEHWSEDLDAIEVFNGGRDNGGGEPKLDWYDFLSRGYRVSVSAGSDSHAERIGVPRVFVPTPRGPVELRMDEITAAFRGQQVYVSCGPFVTFTIDGKGLGETVTSAGPVTAHVRVEAPSWMELAELRLVRNGQVAYSKPASEWASGAGAVRFDGDVALAVDADSWVVLEVLGAGSPAPSYQSPYALTNPIYVDVDGNGAFDAPKPRYRQR